MSPLTKEDVLIIFNDKTLFVVNLVVRTTTFLQNFIVDEWPTTIFPACNTCYGQVRMWTMTNQWN